MAWVSGISNTMITTANEVINITRNSRDACAVMHVHVLCQTSSPAVQDATQQLHELLTALRISDEDITDKSGVSV